MKNLVAISLVTCITFVVLPARPDGCYMPRESNWKKQREHSLINEPDQKALIYFSKGKEQLIISSNYSGNASDFAWVIPVPSRPQIKILQGAPFHELARLVEPAPPEFRAKIFQESEFRRPASPSVTVIERKTIGDYDVTVLSATDSHALLNWLRDNGYHLPQLAEAPVTSYIKEGWTFVASKIRVKDSAPGLKSGTLTPLRLIFDAANPIYPMRLSSANPEPFSLLVYVALPADLASTTSGPFTFKAIKSPKNSLPELHEANLTKSRKDAFPTLSRLSSSGMKIYWMKTRIAPSDCDKDYVWASTTR